VTRPHLPLNALRAFEASARHLSFTRAGLELRVTQTAVSHQVRGLEEMLGVRLFRRLPRGLALTDEGTALLPVLVDTFDRIGATLERFEHGRFRDVVTVGTVGTFATGWLLPRLDTFRDMHPFVDLRLMTHNNRVDVAGDGLDYAIRFGTGSWHGTEATHLLDAPLSPACAPGVAERLVEPADLAHESLLRSYREDEWPLWFGRAGVPCPTIHGWMFDSSVTMAEAVALGAGVALLPLAMFSRALEEERLIRPFAIEIDVGAYWLTRLQSRPVTPGMQVFKAWLERTLVGGAGA
jgi:LysR family transcriptional regulator of beta-lactamase